MEAVTMMIRMLICTWIYSRNKQAAAPKKRLMSGYRIWWDLTNGMHEIPDLLSDTGVYLFELMR